MCVFAIEIIVAINDVCMLLECSIALILVLISHILVEFLLIKICGNMLSEM